MVCIFNLLIYTFSPLPPLTKLYADFVRIGNFDFLIMGYRNISSPFKDFHQIEMFLVRELGLVCVSCLVAAEVDVQDAELQMLSNLGIKLSTDEGES